jgi:hypothetical protein
MAALYERHGVKLPPFASWSEERYRADPPPRAASRKAASAGTSSSSSTTDREAGALATVLAALLSTSLQNTAKPYIVRDDEFEWDDRKAAANLRNHRVSFEVARLAFDDAFAVDREDRREDYGEDRYTLLGHGGRSADVRRLHVQR